LRLSRFQVEHLLATAMRTVRLLGSVVPRNALEERARILAALKAGRIAMPRWTYARHSHTTVQRALEHAGEHLMRLDHEAHPIAQLYAARARELAIEAAIASAAGTSAVRTLGRARFGTVSPKATRLARSWIAESCEAKRPSRERTINSDAPEAGSLLTRMREEVSRQHLAFAVVVEPSLSALAATGERAIFVASGRRVTANDVERTVMHEVLAHAIPRARAMRERLAIFEIGTARGIDHQEGLALVFEERRGFLTPRRKRALAARHLAVLAMDDGANFCDVTRALVENFGLLPEQAILVSERAFRGSDGSSGGLGRERIYMESYVQMRDYLAQHPQGEDILTRGQVAIDAVAVLNRFRTL